MLVRDLMGEKRFRVIHRDTPINEVAGILDSEKIGGAPLVDDEGEVVGLITKSDVVHFEFMGGDPAEGKAWEIGRFQIRGVRETASIKKAAQIMLREQIHRLLVVDADREPLGMLTSFDFVRYVANAPTPPPPAPPSP